MEKSSEGKIEGKIGFRDQQVVRRNVVVFIAKMAILGLKGRVCVISSE